MYTFKIMSVTLNGKRCVWSAASIFILTAGPFIIWSYTIQANTMIVEVPFSRAEMAKPSIPYDVIATATSATTPISTQSDINTTQIVLTTDRKTEHTLIDVRPLSIKSPYTPMEKALDGMNATTSEEILRSGFGLQAYVTENNETIWVENGVQYRPFPFLEQANSTYYDSDFEAYIPFNKTEFFEGDEKKIGQEIKEKKIILLWRHKVHQSPKDGLNPLRACPDFPCVITSDTNYTENSSVLFIDVQFVKDEKPPERRADQIFLLYQVEPYVHYWLYVDVFKTEPSWKHVFNWTMTYRMDSDIPTHYGLVRRRPVVQDKNYREILAAKTGVVAWMVSHCDVHSKRLEYAKELQNYIPVDIFGGCGTLLCHRADDKMCLQNITKHYKFYLGFENSHCKDYITEKLFRFLKADLITIARGSNVYSRILPSEIFINTADFKSPKELAARLTFIDKNDDEYIKILREKDKYFTIYEDYPLPLSGWLEYRYEAVPFCELCQRAWNVEKYAKTYPDMESWFWNSTYQCQNPTDI